MKRFLDVVDRAQNVVVGPVVDGRRDDEVVLLSENQ